MIKVDPKVVAVAREHLPMGDLKFIARAVAEDGRVYYLFDGIDDCGYSARTYVEVAE